MNLTAEEIQKLIAEDAKMSREIRPSNGNKVLDGIKEFPLHLYPMSTCETFDVRKNVLLTTPDLSADLIDYEIPKGSIAVWRAYSLFTNCPSGITATFDVLKNGIKAFKYHGDSLNDFKITLALSNDLSQEIDALVWLRGGDRIQVRATLSANPTSANVGARIKGWLLTDNMQLPRAIG